VSRRFPAWVAAALALTAVHLVLLLPTAGGGSFILDHVFRPDAEATLDGAKPYADLDYEYPPLALPLTIGPAAVSDTTSGYRLAFGLEMIAFDLAVVWLLAFAGRAGASRRLWEAMLTYTLGLIAIEHLALARFDLAPGALVLAAAVARQEARNWVWAGLSSLGAGVKAFPLLLVPAFVRGARLDLRFAIGLALRLVVAAGVVLALGDEFGSAISYHANRDLQIETLGATPILVGHAVGWWDARVGYGGGSFNLVSDGASLARALSLAVLACCYLGAIVGVWRRRVAPAPAAALVVAILVVPAPVLSPQFLLWMLPISAAAFGFGRENAVLLGAAALTHVTQGNYDQVVALGPSLVWPLVARNLLLVAYLVLVSLRVFGRRSSTTTPS
jgi:hypothetical protein